MGTTNYVANNSQVAIDTIGEADDQALICRTDNAQCCHGSDGLATGEWRFPSGDVVPRRANVSTSVTFFSSRDTGALRLHHRDTAQTPTGSYCCVISDNTEASTTFCVQLGEWVCVLIHYIVLSCVSVTKVITTSPPSELIVPLLTVY